MVLCQEICQSYCIKYIVVLIFHVCVWFVLLHDFVIDNCKFEFIGMIFMNNKIWGSKQTAYIFFSFRSSFVNKEQFHFSTSFSRGRNRYVSFNAHEKPSLGDLGCQHVKFLISCNLVRSLQQLHEIIRPYKDQSLRNALKLLTILNNRLF